MTASIPQWGATLKQLFEKKSLDYDTVPQSSEPVPPPVTPSLRLTPKTATLQDFDSAEVKAFNSCLCEPSLLRFFFLSRQDSEIIQFSSNIERNVNHQNSMNQLDSFH